MIYCVTIMKVVLFFQATTRKSWLQKLSGVHRFAQEHDWFVQVVERFATGADIRHALKAWNPVGCLVDRAMTSSAAPDIVFRGIPTVYLDQNPAKPSAEHPCLLHDSAASAGLAIKELVSRNCRSYAYLGTEKNIHWDRARQMRFETDMAAAGRPFVILHRKTLPKTMKELPKPCGILGANDYCAMEAYHAALVAGLKIPDDVLVVTDIASRTSRAQAIVLQRCLLRKWKTGSLEQGTVEKLNTTGHCESCGEDRPTRRRKSVPLSVRL